MNDELQDLIDKLEPRLRDAFLAAIRDLRNGIDMAALEAALRAGDIDRAIAALNIENSAFSSYLIERQAGYADAGAAVSEQITKRRAALPKRETTDLPSISSPLLPPTDEPPPPPTLAAPGGGNVNFRFDMSNPRAAEKNLFKAFADSVVNSLNRIIDKLLDRTLNGFLDSMFSGGGGGFLGSLFGGGSSSSLVAPKGKSPWDIASSPMNFARGGIFDTAQKFAKGGAFTNQIVTSPTLFKFANGGKFGEMGEAGPEAIMPLTRGPNGALGVQAHGAGGQRNAEINVHNEFKLDGAIGPESIVAMIRQANAATQTEIKRNLEGWLREWDSDGAVSS